MNDNAAQAALVQHDAPPARFPMWAVLAAALLGVVPSLPTFCDGYATDEGTLGYAMLRAARGDLPNVDFGWLYTGGAEWIGAAMFRFAEPSLLALRGLTLALSAGIAVLLLIASRRLVSGPLAYLPSAVFGLVGVRFLWLVPYPNWYCVAAALAGALCMDDHRRTGGRVALVLAGLAAAFSFLCKQNLGLLNLAAALCSVSALVLVRGGPAVTRSLGGLVMAGGAFAAVLAVARFGGWFSHGILLAPLFAILGVLSRTPPGAGYAAGPETLRWLASNALLVGTFATALGSLAFALRMLRPDLDGGLVFTRLFVAPAETFRDLNLPVALWPDPPALVVLAGLALALGVHLKWPRSIAGRLSVCAPMLLFLVPACAPASRPAAWIAVFCIKAVYTVPLALLVLPAFTVQRQASEVWLVWAIYGAFFLLVAVPIGLPHYLVYALAVSLPLLPALIAGRVTARFLTVTVISAALAQALFTARTIPHAGPALSARTGLRLNAKMSGALDRVLESAAPGVLSLPVGLTGFLSGSTPAGVYGGGLYNMGVADRATLVRALRERPVEWIVFEDFKSSGWRSYPFPEVVELLAQDYDVVREDPPFTYFRLSATRRSAGGPWRPGPPR